MRTFSLILVTFLLLGIVQQSCTPSAKSSHSSTVSESSSIPNMDNLAKATFGAGCFWCVEAVFQDLEGVAKVESGYMGGTLDNPTYKQVCEGTTGHVEVVRVVFDPAKISYKQLLEVFWQVHDPTTLNRQGNDIGTQYRSVVFYHDASQKSDAEEVLKLAATWWDNPIVTDIAPASTFYIAEDYHQNYFEFNADKNPYCSNVVAPKVAKFRKQFKPMLKESIKP